MVAEAVTERSIVRVSARVPGWTAIILVVLLPTFDATAVERGTVVYVVDGDTIKVTMAQGRETIRLIGVDTPETVDPRKPVQYFGKEASAFTRRVALGKVIRMEGELGTANRDRYGRLLRYVYLPDGRLLNAQIIVEGYGFAYTKYPFGKEAAFRRLEQEAQLQRRGLWADRHAVK